MKTARTALLLFLLFPVTLFADCSSSALYVMNLGTELPQNSIFLLEGYGTAQEVVLGLNSDYPAYLIDEDGNTVPLKVELTHVGMFELTQALLAPEDKLVAGKTYELRISNLPEYAERSFHKSGEKWDQKPKWLIREGTDSRAPISLHAPIFRHSEFKSFGCGPAVNAIFDVEYEEEGEFFIEVELYNISGDTTHTYLLAAGARYLEVGHGMCSGAFRYLRGDKFEVRFRGVDYAGNRSAWSEKLSFTNPRFDRRGNN